MPARGGGGQISGSWGRKKMLTFPPVRCGFKTHEVRVRIVALFVYKRLAQDVMLDSVDLNVQYIYPDRAGRAFVASTRETSRPLCKNADEWVR